MKEHTYFITNLESVALIIECYTQLGSIQREELLKKVKALDDSERKRITKGLDKKIRHIKNNDSEEW